MTDSDGQRGREARQLVDAAMLIAKVEEDVAAEFAAWDLARLERIEAILRANRLHEPTCASLQPVWLPEPANAIPRRPCDCWLTDSSLDRGPT